MLAGDRRCRPIFCSIRHDFRIIAIKWHVAFFTANTQTPHEYSHGSKSYCCRLRLQLGRKVAITLPPIASRHTPSMKVRRWGATAPFRAASLLPAQLYAAAIASLLIAADMAAFSYILSGAHARARCCCRLSRRRQLITIIVNVLHQHASTAIANSSRWSTVMPVPSARSGPARRQACRQKS